jgi:cell division transport system ATP-binding protein
VIHLDNVTKEYARSGPALKDVTFDVRKGEFVFLTGHSGSGKTTALKLVNMSERPSSGEVRVSGYSSARLSDREVWKVRRRVGYVFQDFRLLPGRTALENVAFALEVTGTPASAVRSRAQRLLSQVGLSPKVGAMVNELSGGEQQRVAIARALVNDPVVLLADEPTGNLDSVTSAEIMTVFADLHRQGQTVVMVTHEADIAAHAHRVVTLLDGQVDSDTMRRAA